MSTIFCDDALRRDVPTVVMSSPKAQAPEVANMSTDGRRRAQIKISTPIKSLARRIVSEDDCFKSRCNDDGHERVFRQDALSSTTRLRSTGLAILPSVHWGSAADIFF